ncbi:MAG: LicD family protein [Clostridia bacterium]|nr:LicD family protein [Clostridia bacterium]
MELPNEFFLEEERCGYTVPASMKKVWAVQLDLLEQFRQVCDRHGLRWFVSAGTILGAVRHKGYIPWDDDIDIQMMREDYDKLLEIAPSEFGEPYFFQTAYNDKQFSRGHAQLRNSTTTAILESEKGKFSFNQGIFIDIFPMDAVPDDPAQQAAQRKRVKFWMKLLAATVCYPGSIKKNAVKTLIHILLKPLPYRWVYRQMEKACTAYNGKGMKRVALISFDVDNDRMVWPVHTMDDVLTVPFENTQVPIPAGYDEIMTIQYGDYMTMRKENTYHGGVLFDAERCYKDYLK